MGFVVLILSVCSVLAETQPCIRLEPITLDRIYKKGEALEKLHVLAVKDINRANENSSQDAVLMDFPGGRTVSSLNLP